MVLRLADFPPEIKKYLEYRPDEAKALLAEVGHAGGLKVTLQTTTAFGSPYRELNEAILGMWQDIGVEVKPTWQSRALFSATTNQGDFPHLAWGKGSPNQPKDLSRLRSTMEVGNNLGRVNDPKIDTMLAAFTRATDQTEQKRLADEIQKRIVEQAYVINSPAALQYMLAQPYLRDVGWSGHTHSMQIVYERVWFDR